MLRPLMKIGCKQNANKKWEASERMKKKKTGMQSGERREKHFCI